MNGALIAWARALRSSKAGYHSTSTSLWASYGKDLLTGLCMKCR